jgi:hypothetical protein
MNQMQMTGFGPKPLQKNDIKKTLQTHLLTFKKKCRFYLCILKILNVKTKIINQNYFFFKLRDEEFLRVLDELFRCFFPTPDPEREGVLEIIGKACEKFEFGFFEEKLTGTYEVERDDEVMGV